MVLYRMVLNKPSGKRARFHAESYDKHENIFQNSKILLFLGIKSDSDS